MIVEFRNILNTSYSRLVATGIHNFAMENRGVRVRYPLSAITGQQGTEPGDGIISQTQDVLQRAVTEGIPCVNVSSRPMPGIPQVCGNNQTIYELVFDHLRERNFRTVALLNDEQSWVSLPRRTYFLKACTGNAYLPHVIGHWGLADISLENQEFLASLQSLPKPAAIVLTSDVQGPRLFKVCDELGLRIPQDVAVVGIGNLSSLSSAAHPTLSSVDTNAAEIGFTAAAVLARMIAGDDVPEQTLVEPKELIVRKSSDITIHLSLDLAKAIDYLRTHLHDAIEMEDIVRQQRLGRRALELHFKSEFNETPMQYLRTLRLEKIRNLLETTTLSVTEIGQECGMPDINYLCRLFRKLYHTTPLNYRKRTAR